LFSNQENIHEKKKYLDEFINQTLQYIKEHNIHVIHAHYWLSGLVAKKIKETNKIPFVFTSHSLGIFLKENNLERISYEKEIFSAANKITSSSKYEKDNLLNRYSVNPLNIENITPGINDKIFKMYKGEKKKNRILSVGRIQEQKGQLQILDLFKNLQYRINDLELFFIGGPSGVDGEAYLTKIKNKIEDLQLEDDIQFLGSLSQKKLAKLMRRSKLLIHSAEHETFGLVAVEAHRSGLPVISINQGPFKEIITNDKDGLITQSFESIQAYDFIIKLFENSNFESELAKNAVQSSSRFNWELATKDLKKIYKDIVI
jgi:glycosyltransferase involved in cell wall biosynthesis